VLKQKNLGDLLIQDKLQELQHLQMAENNESLEAEHPLKKELHALIEE